jgi:hypothetical protein
VICRSAPWQEYAGVPQKKNVDLAFGAPFGSVQRQAPNTSAGALDIPTTKTTEVFR